MRYPLRIAVGYRWKDNGGVSHGSKGWTRNVSEEGVFIQAGECPAEADLIDLFFRMPRVRALPAVRTMRMAMKASVVRVEHDAELGVDVGFAVYKRSGILAGDDGPAACKRLARPRVAWRVN